MHTNIFFLSKHELCNSFNGVYRQTKQCFNKQQTRQIFLRGNVDVHCLKRIGEKLFNNPMTLSPGSGSVKVFICLRNIHIKIISFFSCNASEITDSTRQANFSSSLCSAIFLWEPPFLFDFNGLYKKIAQDDKTHLLKVPEVGKLCNDTFH